MPPRTCRVSFTDAEGIDHGVEVLADSLYEAAALALSLMKGERWLAHHPAPLTRLRVEVREPAVEHSLTVQSLRRWIERTPRSPAERVRKERLRALLQDARG
jgi:hypothetical protein